jgi:hypothetical protein
VSKMKGLDWYQEAEGVLDSHDVFLRRSLWKGTCSCLRKCVQY